MPDADRPAVVTRVPSLRENAAVPAMHQPVRDSGGKDFGGAVEGVALAHGVEIERRPGLRVADCARLPIEDDILAADAAAGHAQLILGGQRLLISTSSPEGRERFRRGVESSSGLFRKLHRLMQEFEQVSLHVYRAVDRAAVEQRQLAVETIDRYLVFERLEQVECRRSRLQSRGGPGI